MDYFNKNNLQNISIDPITKALQLELPQETSQTKKQFQNLMHERLCVDHFVPIVISQAVKSREYRATGYVEDEKSYKISMILMSPMCAQKIN